MSRGWRALLLFAAWLHFALIAPALHAQSAQQTGKILGFIRVSRGDFPDHPILLTLSVRGAPMDSIYADDQGRFAFGNLLGNQYTVSIDDDGYEPFSVSVDVNPDFVATNFVQITI